MSVKKEMAPSPNDTTKLVGAIALFLLGLVAYYQVGAMGYPLVLSILALLAFLGLAVFLFIKTAAGSALFGFFAASQAELRRVVWPTRQEAIQLTLVVVFVVLMFGVFLWVIDSVLEFVRFNLIGG